MISKFSISSKVTKIQVKFHKNKKKIEAAFVAVGTCLSGVVYVGGLISNVQKFK